MFKLQSFNLRKVVQVTVIYQTNHHWDSCWNQWFAYSSRSP